MDDYISTRVKLAIREDIMKREEWSDPRMLDGVKQRFQECSPEDIEALYLGELRAKIESMSETELRTLLDGQCAMPESGRNCLLVTIVQAKLA